MRVVVLSIVDDWPLGSLLASSGHQILAWVRPSWEIEREQSAFVSILRRSAKLLLSQGKRASGIDGQYDIRRWLKETGTQKISCNDVNDQKFLDSIDQMQPDLLIVAVYPQILKAPLLKRLPRGVINYHPSLLPRYAGPQPAYWVLRNGEEHTGITVHWMTEKIDAGDILGQEVVPIRDDDNVGRLMQRLHHRAAPLIVWVVNAIESGAAAARVQDVSARTYYGRRKVADAWIDWNEPALSLANRLRAVAPFEPLRTRLRGRCICIFDAHAVQGDRLGEAGEILEKRGGTLVIQTGSGQLKITEYEIEPFHRWINSVAQWLVPGVGNRFESVQGTGKIEGRQ